jgi:hypothetical protein
MSAAPSISILFGKPLLTAEERRCKIHTLLQSKMEGSLNSERFQIWCDLERWCEEPIYIRSEQLQSKHVILEEKNLLVTCPTEDGKEQEDFFLMLKNYLQDIGYQVTNLRNNSFKISMEHNTSQVSARSIAELIQQREEELKKNQTIAEIRENKSKILLRFPIVALVCFIVVFGLRLFGIFDRLLVCSSVNRCALESVGMCLIPILSFVKIWWWNFTLQEILDAIVDNKYLFQGFIISQKVYECFY